MFGHQDEPVQQTSNDQVAASTTVGGFDSPPATDVEAAPAPSPAATLGYDSGAVSTPTSDTNYLLEAQAADGQTGAPAVQPAADPVTPVAADTVSPSPTPASSSDSLIDLKQQALQQLSPLVGQLEQTPEEKFRTTMMLIQASDNQDLLQAAYDAANQITDEKARAQALLDVINEINYFSQSQGK
jgi:hypothetical protein